MDNFDFKKYLAEGRLLKETPEEEFEDSISKDVPSFRADLAKDISDKDILNVIKMLLENNLITGQNILLDGGYTLW